ncbi:hypothetical protein HUT18_18365 [Streptomyces sp. NA04227]|uniref:hypothetical protein n=1 Tax=Streptomyces sp. NA04227 TaxID=2742136 RepID=UPI00159197DF|nr:hypothetical protein [Streptomyces sp. NA04227]QKW08052.1 hypothetical protein HUT18_18365 [Streptomyces sp. NA04227]
MDQGLAAVLGAATGVVGSVGAAVLTYIGVRHQVRATAEEERKQVVRSERVDAYSAFVAAAMEAIEAVHVLRAVVSSERDNPTLGEDGDMHESAAQLLVERTDFAQNCIRETAKCQARLLILGPLEVVEITHDVLGSARKAFEIAAEEFGFQDSDAGRDVQYEESVDSFAREFGKFSAVASQLVGELR